VTIRSEAEPGTGDRPGVDLFAKVVDGRVEQYRLAESLGLMPFYREMQGEIGPSVMFDGREMIMLGSNNYLGLTTDPRVRAPAARHSSSTWARGAQSPSME
jgi:8-amino-7-oxononanoate synthase